MQTAVLFKAPVSYQHEGQNRLQTVSQSGNGKTRKLTYNYNQTQISGPSSRWLTARGENRNTGCNFTN